MCAFGKISFFDISRPELEAVKDTYFEDQISSFFFVNTEFPLHYWTAVHASWAIIGQAFILKYN